MKLRYFFIVAALFISLKSYGQTGRDIHGTVIDSTKVTLPGSTVKLLFGKDSVSTITDIKGAFLFSAVKAGQFTLIVTSIGYDPIKRHITLDATNNPVFLRPIILKTSSTMLQGVTIRDVIPVKIKEDTIEFSTAPIRLGTARLLKM